jgi:uncharacterized protein (DUF302 family)
MSFQRRALLAAAISSALLSFSFVSHAQPAPAPLVAGSGWVVMPSSHRFADLVQRLEETIKRNGMGLVNWASASDGASAQGIAIPGNRVVGVFRNDFARRMLSASIPAGIEAPIRFYLTENADGTATLSYRTPGAVFRPYFAAAGPDLKKVAEELDPIFAKIASEAAKP